MTADPLFRPEATALLESVDSHDEANLDRLVALVYDELREMAHRQLAREHRTPTIQTTELVHEAYLRLVDDARVGSRGRSYFFGAASRAMRRVLIEGARRRGARKRGGGEDPLTLDEDHLAVDEYAAELLELDTALEALEEEHPRQARVVECRYFGGLSVEETAAALEVSPRTVKGDWAQARTWLYDRLHGPGLEAGA